MKFLNKTKLLQFTFITQKLKKKMDKDPHVITVINVWQTYYEYSDFYNY